jgi:hypothetical protein
MLCCIYHAIYLLHNLLSIEFTSLPDLTVLPTEIFVSIYTNSPSIYMLPTES